MKQVVQKRIFMLTNKQYARRSVAILTLGASTFLGFELQRQYMLSRANVFYQEYDILTDNPNFYHTLHEQVNLGLDVKAIEQKEKNMQITRLREQLVAKAEGVVLETNIGVAMNHQFYNYSAIRRFIGCDWVQSTNKKAEMKSANNKAVTIINCDMHKTPFSDNSFDAVVDTFGLECSYNLNHAYSEIKRLTKPGGKILLLERGLGFWRQDNFSLMRQASVNLGARGQVYHHDFASLIENDSEVRVIKKKRKVRGMLYYYELQKL